MRKVALYGRVSTEEQRDYGLSIAAQRQRLHEYCKEKGYTNVEEYFDEGVSAGAMKKRKQFQRLLDDCRRGKVELILFTKLDRWFRHVGKYHVIQDELTALGVPWIAILEPMFETVTAIGRGHINFYLTTAQIEVDRASERVTEINKYKLTQRHALTGNMPFGYKIGEDKRPAIDETTAPIAKYILETYEKVQSKRQLLQMVNADFDLNLSYGMISDVLKNKRYTGMFRGIPDYFPPLISVAQFDKNQEISKRNIKNKTGKYGHHTYLFTGLLRCAVCGKNMGSSLGRGGTKHIQYAYRCTKYSRGKTCTNNHSTNETVVERILLQKVKESLDDIKLQIELRKQEQRDEPLIDVEGIKEEQKRLNIMFQKGRISEEDYELEFEKLDGLLSQAAIMEPREGMELIFQSDFDEIYNSFTKEERRLFWRDVLNYVTVKGRDIKPYFLI